MNKLQVTCMPFDQEEPREVTNIDFRFGEITFSIPNNDWLQCYNFKNVFWVDFGTTRWYPNGK